MSLRFDFDWEPSPGVRTPEFASTWARLEIWVDDECVTRVEDPDSGTTRRSVYGSLYPLAEWIAYNWWFLSAHARPAQLDVDLWSYGALGRPPRSAYAWLRHHNVRAAGDGFSWPDMTVVPEGDVSRLVWYSDRHRDVTKPVRFIDGGQSLQDTDQVMKSLSQLVESVITRLREAEVNGTSLEKEWDNLRQTEAPEAEFCIAAARLGLDPYSEALGVSELVIRSSEILDAALFEDFVNAASPTLLASGLEWVETSSELIDAWSDSARSPIGLLREFMHPYVPVEGTPEPWVVGYQQARSVRQALELDSRSRIDLQHELPVTQSVSPDRSLEAVGGLSPSDLSLLVIGRPLHEAQQRFAQARGLWHLVFASGGERKFLLTRAHTTKQKTERAFAAELLAPAEGIRDLLDIDPYRASEEDLDTVADHFMVSPWLIRHQIENLLQP